MKKINRTRFSLAVVAVVGSVGFLAGPQMLAWAQTLAGTMAAGAAGATLGAAAGGVMRPPSKIASKATDAAKKRQAQAAAVMNGQDQGATPNMPNVSMNAKQSAQPAIQPEKWSDDSGQQMLNQLTEHQHRHYSRGHIPKKSHTVNVLAKYRKPPVGWLAAYLAADRYKVTSHVWEYTTTPNDKFYYKPWVLATKHRPPGQIIGFHSWQDAMIAGYRPDPESLPAPGRKLAVLATWSDGPMMQKYVEYVYAGQISPGIFNENFQYVTKVGSAVEKSEHWSNLTQPTVEQAIGATLGLTSAPTFVGYTPQKTTKDNGQTQGQNEPGGAPSEQNQSGALPPVQAQGKRMGAYNRFQKNAGSLAAKPGSRNNGHL